MKVVYSNGTGGTLTAEECKNLYIQNRFTKEDWQKLESEMNRIGIIKFDDPVFGKLGADLISIEYVRNQITSH